MKRTIRTVHSLVSAPSNHSQQGLLADINSLRGKLEEQATDPQTF